LLASPIRAPMTDLAKLFVALNLIAQAEQRRAWYRARLAALAA
jgi:hypothetical protein